MRIADRCFAVTRLGYAPPWYVNAGIILGDRITLVIDTGSNAAAAATIHGYAHSLGPSNELRVINTERHFRHIGGNSYFRQLGIDVWGHTGIQRTPADFEAEVSELNELIPNPVRRAHREAFAFFQSTEAVNPNRTFECNFELDLGSIAVQVLLTPGHTPTNVSAWVPSTRCIYTGDCLIRSYLPNLEAGAVEDWRTWLQSLELIQSLNAEFAICGHGPVAQSASEVTQTIAHVRHVLHQAIANGSAPTQRDVERTA